MARNDDNIKEPNFDSNEYTVSHANDVPILQFPFIFAIDIK